MIYLHNTLSGKKELFVPQTPGQVRMYVCGVTPYDVCHLGHARCYAVFDVWRRVFRAFGFQVRFIQNFTDVDDKIIDRARDRGLSVSALVRQNIDDFFTKMDALGVDRASAYPRVTEHIDDIVALIQTLVAKKAAYELNGDVYFAVRAFADYGKLSKRQVEDLRSGARVEVNADKRDPLDFTLWKAAKPGEPAEVLWDSPWGKGRPGWHIECSAMSLKHLGPHFDIHGGGLDLIFPHHENEIAQSEAAVPQPFAQYWLHNGFVTVNKEKMSKSLGNFFTLAEIFEKYHPSVVRYMLLSVHYRAPLDFSQDLLEQSRHTLANLKDAIARITLALRKDEAGAPADDVADPAVVREGGALLEKFRAAMADDLNTPEALGTLHQLLRLAEGQLKATPLRRANVREILNRIRPAAEMLGLDLMPSTRDVLIPSQITEWAKARDAARAAKQWGEADRLRQAISDAGYVVEDTPQGPRLLPKAN